MKAQEILDIIKKGPVEGYQNGASAMPAWGIERMYPLRDRNVSVAQIDSESMKPIVEDFGLTMEVITTLFKGVVEVTQQSSKFKVVCRTPNHNVGKSHIIYQYENVPAEELATQLDLIFQGPIKSGV
jgi:hypothetical protein